MKSRISFSWGVALAGAWLSLAGGCNLLPPAQLDPTRYFVLTVAAAKPAEGAAPASAKRWRVGLRLVEVPAFLHGKDMLVRLGTSEVKLVEEARWAEPLEAGVTRVLRESLEARAEVAEVSLVSASSDTVRDLDLRVRLLRCEGDREARVARVTAAVEFYSTGNTIERRAREMVTAEISGWDGKDYGQLAGKLSEAVDALAGKTVALLAGMK